MVVCVCWSRLKPEQLGIPVEIRGLVVRVDCGIRFVPGEERVRGFMLQECNRTGGNLPAQVNCIYNHDVELQTYVKLTGSFKTYTTTTTT